MAATPALRDRQMTTIEENDPGLRFETEISPLRSDQNFKVLNMLRRLDMLERKFRNFDVPAEKRTMVKHFRNTIYSMFGAIDDGKDMLRNLVYINRKIHQLEKEFVN